MSTVIAFIINTVCMFFCGFMVSNIMNIKRCGKALDKIREDKVQPDVALYVLDILNIVDGTSKKKEKNKPTNRIDNLDPWHNSSTTFLYQPQYHNPL